MQVIEYDGRIDDLVYGGQPIPAKDYPQLVHEANCRTRNPSALHPIELVPLLDFSVYVALRRQAGPMAGEDARLWHIKNLALLGARRAIDLHGLTEAELQTFVDYCTAISEQMGRQLAWSRAEGAIRSARCDGDWNEEPAHVAIRKALDVDWEAVPGGKEAR